MASANADFAPLKVSTRDLPERDRFPFWQDFFSQKIVRCDFKPLSALPFQAEATLHALPGLRIMWSDLPVPMRGERTRDMVGQADDYFALIVKEDGLFSMAQRGVELSLDDGGALGFLLSEPTIMMTSEVRRAAFIAPRDALAPLVKNIEDKAMRRIPKDREALRLLMHYASLLRAEAPLAAPDLSHLASTHIRDLIAMALGPTPDGAAIAKDGGVRAARLCAIKADIFGNLTSPNLTLGAVAHRQGVTPRYIHMLFENEGVTFTEFVCEARLRCAHGMLIDPRFCGRSIMTIAFAAGFGDLSYFNRCFRRRFGASPSDFRCDACKTRKDGGPSKLWAAAGQRRVAVERTA